MLKTLLNEEEKRFLEEYLTNHFLSKGFQPPENEGSAFWASVLRRAEEKDAATAINEFLLAGRPLTFSDAAGIEICLYQASAGQIPVITLSDAGDFEALVTNLVYKGVRPANISSTGSSFVFGKKMRLIILSKKPYSNVSAGTMGLSEEEWKEKSMIIRREHECTHFFTKVRYGCAQNHLHDELIADFCGIYEAFGEYKAEYFEYFMGIRGSEGSRLSYYIKDVSPAVFSALKEVAVKAARSLEAWSKSEEFSRMSKEERIERMCAMTLEI